MYITYVIYMCIYMYMLLNTKRQSAHSVQSYCMHISGLIIGPRQPIIVLFPGEDYIPYIPLSAFPRCLQVFVLGLKSHELSPLACLFMLSFVRSYLSWPELMFWWDFMGVAFDISGRHNHTANFLTLWLLHHPHPPTPAFCHIFCTLAGRVIL